MQSNTDRAPARSRGASTFHFIMMLIAILILPAATYGCARVKPWDRDLLADPRMQQETEALNQGLDDHVYFSKEAATGGRGFGGGGCGCN